MPKSALVRNLLIALALVVVALVVFWAINTGARGKEITVDQMYAKIESGSVTQMEFSNKYITVQTNDGKHYWIYNNQGIGEHWLQLFAQGTEGENAGNIFDFTKIEVNIGSGATFDVLNILLIVILAIVMIVILRMFLKQITSANNKSFDFVKNRARVMPSTTKFTDVAGADEEKAELEEIIEFLKSPDRFIKMGARIPKGVLLVGPPGTGKTLLAKACAGEANVPFFTISGSDFMELFVGVGASRVRDLFENAKKAKPCIVFIDEIDAIGRQRGAGMGGGNDEREQTLNQLLVQMDGFEQNEGIIVLAATNRVDILDPALLRPGRFDRRVHINRPDVKGREDILKIHAANKPLASDVNLKHVARITSGFTGADIENMLNESALLAAKAKASSITMENINDAIAKVTMGPQKRSYVITEKDKKITAVHEAGHAIIGKCVNNNDTIHEVSIVPRGNAGGYTMSRPETDDKHVQKQNLLDNITMLLGGRTAEKLFLNDISTGASNDIERATSIAKSMVTEWGMSDAIGLVSLGSDDEVFLGRDYAAKASYSEHAAMVIDQEIKKIIDECAKRAEKLLKDYKAKLNTMVDVLIEKETIYQEEIDLIMQGKTKKQVLEVMQKHIDEDKAKQQATQASENTNSQANAPASAASAEAGNGAAQTQPEHKMSIDELIELAEKRQQQNEKAEKSEPQADKLAEQADQPASQITSVNAQASAANSQVASSEQNAKEAADTQKDAAKVSRPARANAGTNAKQKSSGAKTAKASPKAAPKAQGAAKPATRSANKNTAPAKKATAGSKAATSAKTTGSKAATKTTSKTSGTNKTTTTGGDQTKK